MPSIESRMLEPLRRCGRVRVTCHLLHQRRIDNPRSGETGDLDPSNYDVLASYAGQRETPPDLRDSAAYRAIRQHGDRWGGDGASLHNALLQLHALESAWDRVRMDASDVIVYLRPDLLYHDSLDPGIVRHVARHPSVCALPGWQWHRGCNDRFAVCGPRAAEVYATRAHLIEEWCRGHRGPFEPEALLAFALRRGNVHVVAMPLRASRVRLGGRVHDERFTGRCLESPGVRLRLWQARLAYTLLRFERS